MVFKWILLLSQKHSYLPPVKKELYIEFHFRILTWSCTTSQEVHLRVTGHSSQARPYCVNNLSVFALQVANCQEKTRKKQKEKKKNRAHRGVSPRTIWSQDESLNRWTTLSQSSCVLILLLFAIVLTLLSNIAEVSDFNLNPSKSPAMKGKFIGLHSKIYD